MLRIYIGFQVVKFYCLPFSFPSSSSSFLLFSLPLLLLISFVFPSSPPPPHFNCFPSSSSSILLFFPLPPHSIVLYPWPTRFIFFFLHEILYIKVCQLPSLVHFVVIGTLSNHDDDGSQMNLSSFKLNRVLFGPAQYVKCS